MEIKDENGKIIYPKWVVHGKTGKRVIVANEDEEAKTTAVETAAVKAPKKSAAPPWPTAQ